ncbi:MAG: hypothetical protein KKE42_02210 [Alphaproteobacteria bacterium]|jgi:hypothetical protein|uniref:hypothetical protein n=1 Tax=Brevundimonas sp. TaxID=1871086 RepID=UPI0011F6031F|nr:hypothetical protein [Brevundimonas sp.]MBU3970396.1 hypothetical protein [Alphaproteobacteria bacterium]MBA3048005.1 hypothetical protein [Brevundimonas sp.]MBU3972594.1 hypothetical protein [Alphaproteobacteria bacterium]MBU4040481.1 hypothetical protein [Alphaproteobacteria bacterium]MBU4135297.1 hypothetical protein [Alphaproteobacteria bacterium]
MSADEFDPDIERLFARAPQMPDAALFTAQVEQKLQKGSRVRFLALGLAGLVGGVVAVREVVTVNLGTGEGVVAGDALGQGIRSASLNTQGVIQSGLDQFGLANLELGSMGGMQMFWIAAAALIAVAAAGVMRLSQDI